jgi:hypothetical protein
MIRTNSKVSFMISLKSRAQLVGLALGLLLASGSVGLCWEATYSPAFTPDLPASDPNRIVTYSYEFTGWAWATAQCAGVDARLVGSTEEKTNGVIKKGQSQLDRFTMSDPCCSSGYFILHDTATVTNGPDGLIYSPPQGYEIISECGVGITRQCSTIDCLYYRYTYDDNNYYPCETSTNTTTQTNAQGEILWEMKITRGAGPCWLFQETTCDCENGSIAFPMVYARSAYYRIDFTIYPGATPPQAPAGPGPVIIGTGNGSIPTVSASALSPTTINEGGTPNTTLFRVTRSSPSTSGDNLPVTFNLNGTATYLQDYTIAGAFYNTWQGGYAIIPAGQDHVDITITAVDDSVIESPLESVALAITSQSVYTIGTASATIQIQDNDGCVARPSGLVAWWRAEGNTLDSISGASATLVNGASINSNGKVGQTFNFDGIDDFVRIEDRPELRITGPMSIEAWVYPTSSGTWDNIVTKWDMVGGFNQRSYSLGRGPDQRAFFVISSTGTDAGATSLYSSSTIPVNQWSHLIGTFDGSTVKIYVNGGLQGQASHTGGIWPGAAPVAISGAIGGGGPNQVISAFPGRIDEASIYNRGLTLGEVQSLFNSGSAGKCPP